MDELDNEELVRIVNEARKLRGGKPAKYPHLEKYGESIVKLLERDVQLPYILKWLTEDKGEELVLNTLRKYVVRKIGRDAYENYLKRNGWLKTKKTQSAPETETVVPTIIKPEQETNTNTELGFELDFKKPPTFKRTER